MNALRLPIALALCVSFTVLVLGADFWESKEYTSWSEKDCMKLLKKSPWAFVNRFSRVKNIGSVETGERETTEYIEFRLLSALPVRMAFFQLQLLEKPDNSELQAAIEEQLKVPAGDKILVQISYHTVPAASGILQDLHKFFHHATLSTFHGNTYLVADDGPTVHLSEYRPWTQQQPNAVFVFPRVDENGNPYFTGKEKTIGLRSEFSVGPTPEFTKVDYRIYVKMKPKDMVFKGKFEM